MEYKKVFWKKTCLTFMVKEPVFVSENQNSYSSIQNCSISDVFRLLPSVKQSGLLKHGTQIVNTTYNGQFKALKEVQVLT